MLYLYLGFLIGQSYSVAEVIYTANIPFITIVFSVTVFLIWSFFPVLGYAAAKVMGAKGECNQYTLILLGVTISLVEKTLYHYEILTTINGYLGMLITGIMFFLVGFLSINKKPQNPTTVHQREA